MANEIKVNLVLNGKGESVEKITKIVKDLENSGAKISGTFNNTFSSASNSAGLFSKSLGSISLGAGLVGSGIAAAGAVVISVFKNSIAEAANFEKSLIGLNSVAKNLGQDTGRLGQVVLDLTKDGLIPASEAAAGLKNLMASGLSLDQSIKLFNSLKDSAAFNRQGFLSMGEAIVGATQGIKNGNSIMVDNAGITKNLSVMQKEYAASIGTTVGKLTEAQKVQAAYVGISKEAMIFQGDAEKLTQTYSGSIDQLSASYSKVLISIGKYVTESQTVINANKDISSVFDILADKISNKKVGSTERIENLKKETSTIDGLLESYGKLIGSIHLLAPLNAGVRIYNYSQKKDIEALEEFEKKAGELRSKMSFSMVNPLDQMLSGGNSAGPLRQGDSLAELMRGNGGVQERLAIVAKKQAADQARIELENQNKQKENQEKIYKQLLDKYKDFNVNKVKELQNAERRELSIAGNNEKLKLAIKENYAQKIFEIETTQTSKINKLREAQYDYEKKLEKDRVQQIKNRKETIGAFFENVFSDQERGKDQSVEDFNKGKMIGTAGGLAKSVLGGAEGARNLLAGAGGMAADAFMPGLGQVVGPLIGELSKGPEHVKGMVKEFAAAVPDLVVALVEAIPAFIEEVANQTPVIIERLAEKSDEIVMAIVKGMPKAGTALALAMPKAALAFINKLIEGAGDFVQAMIDAINPFKNESGGAIGTTGGAFGSGKWDAKRAGTAVLTGGVSEAWNTVSSWFADGGIMTPRGPLPLKAYSQGGIANSPQVAIFGEGRMNEAYVPLPNGKSIPVEMRGQKSSESNNDYLLAEIIRLLRNPTIVSSSLNINNRAFGEIILEMAKSNQRLA